MGFWGTRRILPETSRAEEHRQPRRDRDGQRTHGPRQRILTGRLLSRRTNPPCDRQSVGNRGAPESSCFVPLDGRHRMRPGFGSSGRRRREGGPASLADRSDRGHHGHGGRRSLADLAEVAHRHGLWLHVDGAYGAPFALTEQGKRILRGIERSDSVVLDPHKGYSRCLGSGAVLGKRRQQPAGHHH